MSHRFGNAADRKGRRNSLKMHIYEGKGNASGILQKMRRCNTRDRHLALFRRNLDVYGSGSNSVTDAHIAALAMEYNAGVHTTDRRCTRD